MPCPWTEDNYIEALNSEHVIFAVAEADGGVVGFGLLYLSIPEAELPDIVVDGGFQGKGVGRKLLAYMLEEADKAGVTDVFLEVRQSNERAHGLYLSMGFEEIGIRKNFYNNPVEHAICMCKRS